MAPQPRCLLLPTQIFQAAGFADAGDATRVALVLGGFKLVMTVVAVTTVDSWGRRPLLLWGVGGIVASLLVLAGASLEGGPLPAEFAAWTNLLALLAYVGSYQVHQMGWSGCRKSEGQRSIARRVCWELSEEMHANPWLCAPISPACCR